MKKFLNTLVKIAYLGIGGLLGLCLLFLWVCRIHDGIQSRKEAGLIYPPGQKAELNGHAIHVYTEGDGELTCVFLSGLGICAPSLEFKGLYTLLSDTYRIAVVDRAGYGYSEPAGDERDLDDILEETREALGLCGMDGPYVLFPHSIAGMEAIYWAQKYPHEIKAIMGMDIGFPEGYLEQGFPQSAYRTYRLQAFLTKWGVHRLLPDMFLSQEVLEGYYLTEMEKEEYKALSYKNLLSGDVVREFMAIEENAAKSAALPLPAKTPIRIIMPIPLTEEEAVKKADYEAKRNEIYGAYVGRFDDGALIHIPGMHNIYESAYEEIAKVSKEFIEGIGE